MKEKVFEWIQQGCNFNEGLTLLSSTGKNKPLSRAMAGHEKRYAGKLLYELTKLAGFTIAEYQQIKITLQDIVKELSQDNPPAGDPPAGDPPVDNPPAADPPAGDPPVDNPPAADPPAGDSPAPAPDPETPKASGVLQLPVQPGQLPEVVEKVIKEHADLFKLRAQLHEQMAELPEDNSDENIKKRKNLSDSIALISPRIDLMFAAKEAFFNEDKLPEMSALFPELEPVPEPVPPAADTLPADPAELKKMKKNLQSSNTKDQNMLEYQEEKKAAKPNPMPQGPKRLKLEARIKERIEKINAIDTKLL